MKAPQRDDPQFKNSRLRTVLNAIAGGLAGAGPGGAEAGIKVGAALRDMKYNQALDQYKTNLGLAKTKAESEAGRQKIGATEATVENQSLTAESLARAREEQARAATTRADTGRLNQQSLARHRLVLDDYIRWKQANPKLSDMQWLMTLDPEDREDALEIIKQAHAAKQKTDEEIAATERAKLQASIDVKSEPGNLGKQAATAAATGGASAESRALGAARGELGAENLPKNVERTKAFVSQLERDPDSLHTIMAQVPADQKPAVLGAYLAKGNDFSKKLAATQATAVENSKVALGHAANIETLFNDPEIQNTLGPLSGRIAEAVRAYGGKAPGDKGVEFKSEAERQAAQTEILNKLTTGGSLTKKQQQLMGLLAYLVTFEASSASGTRPSWQLINYLGSRSPQLKMDPEAFLGALESVKQSASTRIEQAYKPTKQGMPVGGATQTPVTEQTKPKGRFNLDKIIVQPQVTVNAPGAK